MSKASQPARAPQRRARRRRRRRRRPVAASRVLLLLSVLRRDPDSVPERRSDEAGGGTRVWQPRRADVRFAPRKGDVIIHHEKRPGRKVLEFYDPVCQRLRDGDILVRFKLDSYACEGLVMVKGCGYIYHRGFWVYLGKDSDQIARSCNW